MPVFDYLRPVSLDEAVAALSAADGRGRPLAGGTDLLVQLRAERYELDRVVDVKAIPELMELRYDRIKGLTIGAAVPCYRIYEQAEIAAAYPGLIDAVSILGGIAIQGRASVGGNLCNASPSADSTPALIVHSAICNIVGPGGPRSVSARSFCTAPGQTVLRPGELLVSVQLPAPTRRSAGCYIRFTPRAEMDIAVAGVAAWIQIDENGMIADARVALAAVGPTAIEVTAAAGLLSRSDVSESALDAVAHAAQAIARPITDMRGSADQRRHLVGVLTNRALTGAFDRARGDGH